MVRQYLDNQAETGNDAFINPEHMRTEARTHARSHANAIENRGAEEVG